MLVTELPETSRAAKGFGSSGLNMAVTTPAVDTAMSTEADKSKSQSTENVLPSEKATMPTFGPHTDTNLHNASHTPFSSSCLDSFQADSEARPDRAEPEGEHFLREAVANTLFVITQ